MPLLLQRLPNGAQAYGAVMGALAVGGMIGAHFAPRLRRKLGDMRLMQRCLATYSVLTAVLFGVISIDTAFLPWALASFALAGGACYSINLTCLGIVLQDRAPAGRIASISACFQSVRLTALAAAPLVGATIAQYSEARVTLVVVATFAFGSSLVLRRAMARRGLVAESIDAGCAR